MSSAAFQMDQQAQDRCQLRLTGHWQLGLTPSGQALLEALPARCRQLQLDTSALDHWDSSLVIALYPLARQLQATGGQLDLSQCPPALQRLLALATGVAVSLDEGPPAPTGLKARLLQRLAAQGHRVQEYLMFLGDTSLALAAWLSGRAKTRATDIAFFVRQAGPEALPIVTLIALLVGMILAYLGAIQLRQWGAQVYVADLVAIGMVREMGALMTAVIMAGRTGAAYAAQLGTMQVNEEIDALRVMGVSAMEFLVVPRLLALLLVMPLLCIYADIVGMAGGALIAAGMDVSFSLYLQQTQNAIDLLDFGTGLIKSVFFALLIALAGCQAGMECGRNSTAVGLATTAAVVRAIVYLVVCDAAFNIIYDKMGI